MEGMILLPRAREAGLAVTLDGDALVIRGPSRRNMSTRTIFMAKVPPWSFENAFLATAYAKLAEIWCAAAGLLGRVASAPARPRADTNAVTKAMYAFFDRTLGRST